MTREIYVAALETSGECTVSVTRGTLRFSGGRVTEATVDRYIAHRLPLPVHVAPGTRVPEQTLEQAADLLLTTQGYSRETDWQTALNGRRYALIIEDT